MSCTEYDSGLTICTSPSKVAKVVEVGERWCFRCRKRRQFVDELLVSSSPWYDPMWSRKCERGHLDGDLFPLYVEAGPDGLPRLASPPDTPEQSNT